MALTDVPAPPPPSSTDDTGWGLVRMRIVWAFLLLGSLALASFGVVAITLHSRGDESDLVLMLGDVRHQSEHLRDAEARALESRAMQDPWRDSIEVRTERLGAARVQLDQRAATAPPFIRGALQEAVASAFLLLQLAREQGASIARHDTLSARGQLLASEQAHQQLDEILDRAVTRLMEDARGRQEAAQRFSAVLLVVTLIALALLASRSVLPAVRAARRAFDEAALARRELTERVALVAAQADRITTQSAALQRAQELTSGIIESAGEGILAFDLQQRFILWNPQMERFYGVGAAHVMGRTLAECFPELAAGPVGAAYEKAIAGEVVVVRHREIASEHGLHVTTVDATYRPLFDASGRVVGGVGKLRDVGEERRAKARLERLSAIAEQTSEGVLMTDAEGQVLWANAAWERMTGWTADELEGRAPWEVLRGVDSDAETGAAIARSIAAGASFRGEILNYRRDGTPFWVEISTTPIRDADGALTSFVAIERDVTAEREHARQQQAERAFATSLVESNSDGLFAVDEHLRITEWNPVMERWSRIARADALGRSIDDVIPLETPDHDSRRAARFRALLAGGAPFAQERSYRFPPSGESYTVETVVSPIRDKLSNRVTGALCTVRDIAERRAAEQRFRLLFQHSADGHVLLDDDGLVDCNDAALRLLGYDDRKHFLERPLHALSPETQPDGRNSHQKCQELRDRARLEGAQRFDWTYLRQDGSELLVEATLTAVPLTHGPGLLLVWHDVTARRAVEDAVHRERERLTDAIEALEAGFAMFDAEERLVAFNRTFAATRPPSTAPLAVGDSLGQMLQSMLLDEEHAPTGEPADAWMTRIMACHRGEGVTFEERVDDRAMRVSVTRTRDGGSVALTTDITELVWIQRSLEAARDAERHANHAKSAFLASMSHELRTPLNSIIGFTRQVRKNKAGHLLPTDVTYLERVERNAIQLLALINSLLDLSRIESGKQEVDLAPTELATLLRETVSHLEGQARPGVALHVEAPEEVPLVEVDGPKLRQVVINLVGNALKFTHAGSVTVRLQLGDGGDTGEAGEPTAIEVEDTGIGIPADRLEAIFHAFEQAERTTARDYGGTGLGLNISRSLCALMGARLEVTSVVGVGTTFRVVLGASPTERPAIPALAAPALTSL